MNHLENLLMKQIHYNYDISTDIKNVINRLESISRLLNNKKIIITGGTGFFGIWMLQTLCTLIRDHSFEIELYVVSRNPKLFIDSNKNFPFEKYITFIKGDVVNFVMPRIEIDYLIHMATTAATETFSGEDQLKKIDLLYRGTKNTIENATKNGVKKVLFTSSGVVYGQSKCKFLTENILEAPKTTDISAALGEGKRIAEYLISYYAAMRNYKFSIARCFTFYGPYLPLDIHYAIGNFVRDAMYHDKIVVKGTGQDLRSYLYMGDACVWLLNLLTQADNEIYNVGSSTAISILETANKVRDIISPKKEIEILGKFESVGNFGRNIYIPNNKLITNKYKLREWTTLSDGIKRMVVA